MQARELFEQALARVAAGDAASAEAICRRVLAVDPRDVNHLALLGAVLIRLRRHAEAESTLRRAIDAAPAFAKPREDLGVLLLEMGRAEEAEACLQAAVDLDPSLELAHFTRGKALAALGRGQDADASFERAFALAPNRRLLAEAAIAQREGRQPDAERACRRVLQAEPGNVDALRLLGQLALASGRMADGERLLRRALELAPDFLAVLVDLGRLLKELDRFDEAVVYFRRAVELAPHDAQAQFLLGSVLAPCGAVEEAAAAYRRAIDLEPDDAAAWLGLGHTLKTLGHTTEGIAAYRRCIELRPGNGEGWWSLANLKTYRFDGADVTRMEALADGAAADETSRINVLFSLAKAAEDRADYPAAWDWYLKGNASARQRLNYDPVHTAQAHDALIEVFDERFFADRIGWGDPDAAPIFVLGLPRSGSTLIEQILASHDAVEGTSELPYVGRIAGAIGRNRADGLVYPGLLRELDATAVRALGSEYLQRAAVHRRLGRPRFVDKMPNNFPNAGLIALMLPNARIIDARRNPLDTCVANFRQLYARGQAFSYDFYELGEYYLEYLRIMRHWDAVLPGRVLRVQYEDMVADLEGGVRRLLDFCDLDWQPRCLRYWETDRAIRTASSEQVRQPIYSSSVGQWRRYESELGELIGILESALGDASVPQP